MIQVGLTWEPIRGVGARVLAGVERHIAVWQRANFVSDITRTFEFTSLLPLILSYCGTNHTSFLRQLTKPLIYNDVLTVECVYNMFDNNVSSRVSIASYF